MRAQCAHALLQKFGSKLSEADVDDALQMAIAQMWSRREAYAGLDVNIRGLLFVIAKNALLSVWRTRSRERAALEAAFHEGQRAGEESPSAGKSNIPPAMAKALQEAVNNILTQNEREVLTAWMQAPRGQDWTPQVVQRLQLAPSHLRVMLHRILAKLRSAVTASVLKNEGIS